MDCLKNIVGISNTEDSCFSESFSAEAKKSDSGLYMDQLEEMPSLDAFQDMADSERSTLEGLLAKALENGKQHFKEELYLELGKRYNTVSQSYIGNVGQSGYGSTLSIGFPYAGVVYDMSPFKGAVVKITAVQPFFTTAGDITVTVYRAINNGVKYINVESVGSFTVTNAVPSSSLQSITPISLDTTDETGKAYSYLFIYPTSGLTPRDNAASCGCGGKEIVLHKYLYARGISGDSSDNMLMANRTDKVNGLVIQIDARCTGGNFICENYYSDEFIAEAIKWAVLRKSVSNAMVAMLNSDLISRYTMAKREQMGYAITILNSKFKKSVAWVADNMNLAGNDCFICSPGGNGSSMFATEKDGILM